MTRTNTLILSLIVVLAAGLRCINLSTLGFWTDEFCTLSDAQGRGLELARVNWNEPTGPTPAVTPLSNARPITDVTAGVARDDSHPPLYFLTVRLWEQVFGDGESAVRSVGVIASVATVLLIYFAAAETVGPAAGLRAALITAVAVPQIQFAQEARNYAPAVAASMAAAVALLRLRRGRSVRAAVAFGVSLLAMMLTHYYAASVAVVLVGYATVALGNVRRGVAVAVVVSAAIFMSLWGRQAIAQTHLMGASASWLSDPGPGHSWRALQKVCLLPVRLIADTPGTVFETPSTIVGAGFVVALVPLWLARRDLRLWIAWSVVPVLLVAAVDLANHSRQLFWLRYTLLASPGIFVVIAGAVRSPGFQFLPTGAAVLAALLSLRSAYVPDWKIDFRTPVETIGRRLAPGDIVVICGPDKTQDAITKTAFDHYLAVPPSTTLVLTRLPTATDQAEIVRHHTAWVVWMWPGRRIDDALPGEMFDDRGSIPYFAELAAGHSKT